MARVLLSLAPMNKLIVGTRDKTDTILEGLPNSFLLIDDGSIIDAFQLLPKRRKEKSKLSKITFFDFKKHSFNPLKDIDFKKARDFISVLDAIFPEGANTLTKKNSNFILLRALLAQPKRLDTLLHPDPRNEDSAYTDALQKIQTLLMSPVLKSVLTKSPSSNFPLDGILLVRLNRAELGDFVCFALANFLIANYKGQVVIPDFGFYACPFHTSLIRQKRLIAGVHFLNEAPQFRERLLLIDEKIGRHTTAQDAETLADYAGLRRESNAYTEFVKESIE